MKGLFGALAALFLVSSAAADAEAQSVEPAPAQVRLAADAFDRGRDAYKAEDYISAAEQFETADANAPSAAALELAIHSRDRAGQLDRAATLAALALQRYPDDKSIQRIAPAILERARQELHTLTVHCGEPCELVVAGKLVHGALATDRTLFIEAGRVTVRAGWSDGRSASKQIEVTPATSSELILQPETPTAPVPVRPRVAPHVEPGPPLATSPVEAVGASRTGVGLPPMVFWGGVIVTGISGGVLLWSAIELYSGKSQYDRQCSKEPSKTCDQMLNDGIQVQERTNILIGVSGGLGVATALLGLFGTNWSAAKAASESGETAKRRDNSYQIEPWVALGDHMLIGATGRF